ncbi:hypothetical protein GCM10009802_20110 [Streptomyces synnematoformans]|uniref:Helix-turn-helix transcriptional regulator n=2 Tax=Streptomyces synnematoformans TaxID=415721 RepID=A0ABN2XX90_9ACTN
MSLRALSEALSGVGRALSQDAINKIENGAERDTKKQIRRVDVDDLMALAVVLGVNPSALLLPPTADGDVELTAAGMVSARVAWKWADGRGPLDVPEGDDGTAHVDFQRDARPTGLRAWKITTAAGRKAVRDELAEDGIGQPEWDDERGEGVVRLPGGGEIGEPRPIPEKYRQQRPEGGGGA